MLTEILNAALKLRCCRFAPLQQQQQQAGNAAEEQQPTSQLVEPKPGFCIKTQTDKYASFAFPSPSRQAIPRIPPQPPNHHADHRLRTPNVPPPPFHSHRHPNAACTKSTAQHLLRHDKVFINVCQSEHVDKPAPVEGKSNAEEVQMRIPLSLGPPREDLDKDAAVCTVYDCVFHPDAVENALKEPEFRAFVMQLILHQIQDKYKDELSQVYWDPCLIPPHRVRPILHKLNPVCA